jgi:hypothetical protein
LINPTSRPLEFVIGNEIIGKFDELILVDANLDFLDHLALELENRGKSVKIIDQLDKLYQYVSNSKAGGNDLIEFRFL